MLFYTLTQCKNLGSHQISPTLVGMLPEALFSRHGTWSCGDTYRILERKVGYVASQVRTALTCHLNLDTVFCWEKIRDTYEERHGQVLLVAPAGKKGITPQYIK